VAAICGVIHYYMQVKADVRLPLVLAAVLAVLLGYRLLSYWQQRKLALASPAATTPKTKA
jgi:glycine betaine catabolism B